MEQAVSLNKNSDISDLAADHTVKSTDGRTHLHMEDTEHSSSYTICHLTEMKIVQGDNSVGKILVGES